MARIGCRCGLRAGTTGATIDRRARTRGARVLVLATLAAGSWAPGNTFAQSAPATPPPADASRCVVHHQPFMEAGVAHGTMRVVNDGQSCGFTFRFGMKFDPDTWKIEVAPQHGRLHFDGGHVEYLPDSGYAGADVFTVTAFGGNPMIRGTARRRNGQFAFDVTVRPPG